MTGRAMFATLLTLVCLLSLNGVFCRAEGSLNSASKPRYKIKINISADSMKNIDVEELKRKISERLNSVTCPTPITPTPDTTSILDTNHTKTICEYKSANLTCEMNSTIQIISAIYGQAKNATICPCPFEDFKCLEHECSSKDVTDILNSTCYGKLRCDVDVKNMIFTDPCPNVAKYLTVKYRCVGNTTCSTISSDP